ncbi:leucine-rich repeat transmembrane protein FLRT2 [Brienomyrus brachyistius]|uniref:leucine-rich repeat transmembrane protein FLRT2 n=1 Tax=Brienomyrus brachyistius TaxID=42636 RepID=UPI0020B3F60F|nr:leucine-rich repeat transmembrane protein FLRT2 [Brienomyrus brachyistius]XP_048841991.1 leucine-rich repeat transmembrane protein FLRT2 [Brienomyrus brachyistius]
MELQVALWNKDWPSFLKSWITILLSLHLQFYQAAGCPQECRCDRTFLYCNDRSLTSVPLGIQEGYKILFLHNNQINNAGFPLELHHVSSVETVYLYGNQLDEFPLNLPRNVRVLHLQENNIQTISRAALAQLSRLVELHLDDNSISTVGVEEGAFREAVSLQMLFLTKNHLSSVPIGLPEDLRELRLDENRIAFVAEEAFRNVTRIERLLLDGNLLTDEDIAVGTFQDLGNLRELSLARNSLTTPPPLLPGAVLVKLSLQDNQMNEIPVTAFSNLRQLERLDISSNQLQSLTQGVFDGLVSLRQLTVRNNLWHCDCAIGWVISWLKALPPTLNVRGFMCHKPERLRGMVIRELGLDAIQCPDGAGLPTLGPPMLPHWPNTTAAVSTTLPSPGLPLTTSPAPFFPEPTEDDTQRTDPPMPPFPDPLQVAFHVVNGTCIQVSWEPTFPVTAYKVSWVKLGQSLSGGIAQERTVSGERQKYDLTDLEPRSMYRVCVHVLDAFNTYRPGDDSVCAEATTGSASFGGPEQATQQDANSPLLLAGLIGGAVFVVLVVLLSVFCWHMHKRAGSSSSSSKWKYNRGRRKDDYCEAGTKKDNSILEMTETSFQIVPLNNEQLLKGDFRIQPIYTPNGGIGFRDCHLSNNSTAYCKSNVPNADCCHT